jgi:hypothetical protein
MIHVRPERAAWGISTDQKLKPDIPYIMDKNSGYKGPTKAVG